MSEWRGTCSDHIHTLGKNGGSRTLEADVMAFNGECRCNRAKLLKRNQSARTPVIQPGFLPFESLLEQFTILSEVVQFAGQPYFSRPIKGSRLIKGKVSNFAEM